MGTELFKGDNMNTNDYYYVGVNAEGDKVWLEKPSWDCGWYWGFGYLQTMSGNRSPSNARDISSHTHWNSSVQDSRKNAYDWFVSEFGKPTTDIFNTPVKKETGVKMCRFTNKQVWTLCELMESAYTLRTAAELYGRGGSFLSTNPLANEIKNTREVTRINSKLLPAIFAEIGKIFDEADKAKEPSKPIRGNGWVKPKK